MRIRLISTALVALVVAAVAGRPAPAAMPKTVICGQIEHGPHATYTSLLTKKRLSGTTWTVFATGVPLARLLGCARSG